MEIELCYHFTDEHDYCKPPVSQWTQVAEVNVANDITHSGDQDGDMKLV